MTKTKSDSETRQYIGVRFSPDAGRVYTYHNDGSPVAPGDEVKLPGRSGDSDWKRGYVCEVVRKPTFATRAILGLAPRQEEKAPPDPTPTQDSESAPATPGIGHNVGDEEQQIRDQANALARDIKELTATPIDNDEKAVALKTAADDLRKLSKMVDALRIEKKRPHDDAAAAVQAHYKPILDRMGEIVKWATKALSDYAAKVRAQKQRDAEIERQRVAEAAREAEEKRKATEATGDVISAAEAEKREQDLAKAAKEAERAEKKAATAVVGGGDGRAGVGVRMKRVARLRSAVEALMHYRDRESLIAEAVRIANAEVRASRGAEITIPGFDIIEEPA